MKVLLFNAYYPPDRAATATMAAAAVATLIERGHDVEVVAGRPSYDVESRSAWRPVTRERGAASTVRRVGSTAFRREGMAGRVTNYVSYGAIATPIAAAADADVVLGMTDPPFAGIAAHRIARLRRRPFVYWVQDLHPDFSLATGDLRPGALVRRWQAWHARALAGAAAVVVLGDDMAERVIVAGADARRVHVIRSGANAAPPAQTNGADITRRIRADADFVVMHAGNLGQTVAWQALIDGVRAPARLVFVGGGAERDAARSAAAGRDDVAFFDYWPAGDVGHVLGAGDLHAVTVRRGLEGLVVPSRLYGVFAAGRAVLAVGDEASDVARLVRRHDCGIVADPDDPQTIADAVSWAREHPDEVREMGERAGRAAGEYDRGKLLHRLVDVIESVRR